MYTPTTWVASTTPLSAGNMNNLETSYTQAATSFNQDLFSANGFVLFGFICTKDAVTASQLDITAGTGYVVQSDGTLYRSHIGATNKSTAIPTTTYYLDLANNGVGGIFLSWATSHPGASYITLCTVTTDGSSNILTVTDTRNLYISAVPNAVGAWSFGAPATGGVAFDVVGSVVGTGVVTPTAPTATITTGSGLGTGNYGYKVTYVSRLGESTASPAGTCTTTSGSNQVNLTVIPTGPTGTLSRNIYRTKVGGSTYFSLVTLNDNTTTTYTDAIPDGSIGAGAVPAHPTMGSYQWKTNGGVLLAAVYGDGAMYFDTGNVKSDGSGNFTALGTGFFSGQVTAAGLIADSAGAAAVLFNPVGSGGAWYAGLDFNLTGTTTVKEWRLNYNGSNGDVFFYNVTDSKQVFSVGPGATGLVHVDNSGNIGVAGNIVGSGAISGAQSATAVVLASSGTIATSGLTLSRVNPSGAVTAVILAAGVAGQILTVINESANTVTFAASGTSHVADGASDVIAGTSARTYIYDSGTSLWYHSV